MTFEDNIRKLMEPMTIVTAIENGVRVSTHCLYPSNATVTVVVTKQMDGYVVSDDGEAVDEVMSSGLRIDNFDRKLQHLVKSQGLLVHDNVIYSPRVSLEAVPAVILLVANVSKDASEWMLQNITFKIPRNFKKEVAELLHRYFSNEHLKNNQPILGKSNKLHHFGHVVYLPDKRTLIVDPVVNDPSSINARVIANLDVKMRDDPKIIQRVIYDDSTTWKSSDLSLLEIGAVPVPFSSAQAEIKRLAA